MHGSKDTEGGNIWPSHDKVEWIGANKYKNYEQQREGNKPNTQLGSSSSTSASSSKGKSK
ncbi:MAG: hypothetical protein LKM45_03525 [Wolbachia endosymbiont of Alcedoecus sp.]|nr:hypothetical protein [Wolbachia endosymbiont of Alcedoecus sp.]